MEGINRHGTLLERTPKLPPKKVSVIVNHKPWFDEECLKLVDRRK
jgi:hypothetical protein